MSIPHGLSHAACRNVGARHDLSCAAQAPALPVETPPAELHALHAATVSACVCALWCVAPVSTAVELCVHRVCPGSSVMVCLVLVVRYVLSRL